MSESSPFPEGSPRALTADRSLLLDTDELCALAHVYLVQGMHDEAIHLYEMCRKLNPGSESIETKLADARRQKEAAEAIRYDALRREVLAERARDEMDCSQYVGLAQYYIARDMTPKAIELLEIAKIRSPNNPRPFEALGKLYFSEGEWDLAQTEIQRARELNPFDQKLAELSGRIEFELKNYDKSLRDFVDSFLLTADVHGESTEPLRRMINTVKRIVNLDNAMLHSLIRQQLGLLELYTERLEFRKETLFKLESDEVLDEILRKVSRDAAKREDLIDVSASLRELAVFRHLDDEQVFKLARFTRLDNVAAGRYLFREGDRSMDFYVIVGGLLEVRRETPEGPQVFAALGPDNIIGEMNFLDRMGRSADALAITPSKCYTFSFSGFDKTIDEDKDLAVALHWAFWRSLSEKVRDANEQLKLFFPEAAATDPEERPDSEPTGEEIASPEDAPRKLDLFEERGLTAAEMKLLATFSIEERFRAGSAIFREGDPGDKLYIVMDGKVLVSKTIPGVGEEALAILGRGDFFGEMSLIDQQPRSADARAHERSATVLSINSASLHEVLSLDPSASLQFLNLLCRMISRRLREINEKIVSWKALSGGF